jgi:hypothetical protein
LVAAAVTTGKLTLGVVRIRVKAVTFSAVAAVSAMTSVNSMGEQVQ